MDKEFINKTLSLIPGGTNTLSKGFQRFTSNSPKYFLNGKGAYCFDENGRKYLDFVCGLGAITLGHGYRKVVNAVHKQIKNGTIFSLSHPLETELAELLTTIIPSAEMVRFGKNGVDVTSAAIRLSRYITGRDKILQYGYHGGQDWYLIATQRNFGIPPEMINWTESFDYNRESFDSKFDLCDYAAVIMEPHIIAGDSYIHTDKIGLLSYIKRRCRESNTILIFDEMVTGFRYPGLSAQKYFGVIPDLSCFGKGMANGFPISALVGKKDIMQEFDKVFFSSTFGGELSSIAAAISTIIEMIDKKADLYMAELGELFKTKASHRDEKERIKLIGCPWRQIFEFSDDLIAAKFRQEMYKRGVFFGVPIFFNLSMNGEDILDTCDKIKEVIENIDSIELDGPIPSDVFQVRRS